MPYIGTETPEVDSPLLVYAGHTFRICRVTLWDTRPVYAEDGTDRLYLHHRIGVQAVWNPYATRADDGVAPFVSMAAVREQILRPHQQLRITTGNATVLESPLPNPAGGYYPCDGRNGPNPIALNVVKILGTQSVICYFEIETWVPTTTCSASAPAVLTHRWQQSETMDENCWTSRTTTGYAVFRRDVLAATGQLPDDFRARLFHPVPRRFMRRVDYVRQSSDGARIDYQFTDVEQAVAIIWGDDQSSRGVGSAAWAPTLEGFWKYGFYNDSVNPFKVVYRYINFSIEARGRPHAPKNSLIDLCLAAAGGFGFLRLDTFSTYVKFDLLVNVIRPVVKLDVGIIIDGNTAGALDIFKRLKPFNFLNSTFGRNPIEFPQGINGVTGDPSLYDQPRALGDGNGSRNRTVLTKLVHQLLLEPCAAPTPPELRAKERGPTGGWPDDKVVSSTF